MKRSMAISVLSICLPVGLLCPLGCGKDADENQRRKKAASSSTDSGESDTDSGSDTGESGSDTGESGSDTGESGSDTGESGSDTGENPGPTKLMDTNMRQRMWEIAQEYPTDGTFGYSWPTGSWDYDDSPKGWAGTTQDIYYQGELVADGSTFGDSYCVGITWEVYMLAWAELDEELGGDGTINGMDVDDLYLFREDWYVEELLGAGVLDAAEIWEIGEEVTDWEDALPGDPIQFWRGQTNGHNALFVEWVRDGDGEIAGVEYWSSQPSTDGIGYATETFFEIDEDYFFIARLWSPPTWTPGS